MATDLARAHIEAERRLRVAVVRATEHVWRSLPGYDRENVPTWLSQIVPIVDAANRQSVAITTAYVARSLEIEPPSVAVDQILRSIRNGATPEEVYTRPFITMWTALKNGTEWGKAKDAGMARAASAAATDVQLAMRDTLMMAVG